MSFHDVLTEFFLHHISSQCNEHNLFKENEFSWHKMEHFRLLDTSDAATIHHTFSSSIYLYTYYDYMYHLSSFHDWWENLLDCRCGMLSCSRIACKYSLLLSSNCPLTIRYHVCAIIPPYISYFLLLSFIRFCLLPCFFTKIKVSCNGHYISQFLFIFCLHCYYCVQKNKRPAFHHLKERIVSWRRISIQWS